MKTHSTTRYLVALAASFLGCVLINPCARATNVAGGKLAFADYDPSGTAHNVTDYNTGSSWTNSGSPAAPSDSIGVDLGAPTSIKFVRLYWASGAAPTGFTVDVATNVITDPNDINLGVGDWTTVYTRTNTCDGNGNPSPQPSTPDLIDLSSQNLTYRYVRINATDGPNPCAVSPATPVTVWTLNEFEVLDAAPPSLNVTALAGATPVANAIIQIVGPAAAPQVVASGILQSAETDSSGSVSFPNLEDGTYAITTMPMGKYAPVTGTVTVTGATNSNVAVTTPVFNTAANTAPLPAYTQDFIASAAAPKDANASTANVALPAEGIPAGDTVWFTGDANGGIPAGNPDGGAIGTKVPPTLHFWFPPTATGANNVINPQQAVIPVPAAHYTALYILQTGIDANGNSYSTTATLNYADGTSQAVVASSGSTTYTFTGGDQIPNVDEINAFTVAQFFNTNTGALEAITVPYTGSGGLYRVYLRWIVADSTKVLKSVQFNSPVGGGTFSRGGIFGWSGDTLESAVPATGSISGTIKAPASLGGAAVPNSQVNLLSYRITTGASGTYLFRGLPAGTYSVSANKPANYPLTTVGVTLTAGQNAIQDIQFPGAIPVITDPLTSPSIDEISSDANLNDFSQTGFALGSEYMPAGLYSPATVPNTSSTLHQTNTPPSLDWEAAPSNPSALAFDFGNPALDSPVAPGTAGYPIGGVPNAICLHDYELLAPGTNVSNCYLAITGLDGVIDLTATLHYADGTSESKFVAVSDWFNTAVSPNEYPYVWMHGRHTATAESNTGTPTSSPANIGIKALVIPVNNTKVLHDITFDHGDQQQHYPIVSAVSWETLTQAPASSDIRVTIKLSDGATPAAGAWAVLGPYSIKADANGVAVFKGVPANQTVDLGAYLLGQTQQGRVNGHSVPVGKKMPTPDDVAITLPAAAPHFVQLPLAFDYDMFAGADMPGDFKGSADNDWSYPSELVPASNTIFSASVGNIPFMMPHTETGFFNVQRENGQTWHVTPGHYSSLDFLACGVGAGSSPNSFFHHMTLNYSDGTVEQIQTANQDWVDANWATPTTWLTKYKSLFYRQYILQELVTPKRRQAAGADQALFEAFPLEVVPVNANKTLVSVSIPHMYSSIEANDMSFLAVTLEANDDVNAASGTVSGTVVGSAMTNAASPAPGPQGPIAGAQVIYDDAHMAYTDAGGHFSIPFVPTGAATLKVIPVGTGILTKSFPITAVTAGANSVGTLNVGSAVTQIYAVLGATNTTSGLTQVEGYPSLYATDTGRPLNFATDTDSVTTPVTVNGLSARAGAYASDYFYFKIDQGWLSKGRMGSIGLDPTTLTTVPIEANPTGSPAHTTPYGSGANGVLAPHIYVQVEYLDKGTDTFTINYNRAEAEINGTTSLPTYKLANPYRTPQIQDPANPSDPHRTVNLLITKTNTNTFKKVIFDFNPALVDASGNQVREQSEPFSAYAGQNLEADFRISPNNSGTDPAEVIRSVSISVVPGPQNLPATPSAKSALRIAAGLATATSTDVGVDDVTGPGASHTPDGKITILDAALLAKQGSL